MLTENVFSFRDNVCEAVDNVWAEQLKLMECLMHYERETERSNVISMRFQRPVTMTYYCFDCVTNSVSSRMGSMVSYAENCMNLELVMCGSALENRSLQQCVRMDAPCAVANRAQLAKILSPNQDYGLAVVMQPDTVLIAIDSSAYLLHTVEPSGVPVLFHVPFPVLVPALFLFLFVVVLLFPAFPVLFALVRVFRVVHVHVAPVALFHVAPFNFK